MSVNTAQQINLTRVEANKTIVSINGVDYELTVKTKTDNAWKDVTKERDWTEVANLVSKLCVEMIGNDPIQKMVLETTGGFPNFQGAPSVGGLGFHSVHIDYSDAGGAQKTFQHNVGNLAVEKKPIVTRYLRALAITTLPTQWNAAPADAGKVIRQHLKKNTSIYPVVTSLLYHNDLGLWGQTPNNPFPKPGSKAHNLNIGGTDCVYPADRYGDYRFDSMQDEEFDTLLRANKQALIRHALEKDL